MMDADQQCPSEASKYSWKRLFQSSLTTAVIPSINSIVSIAVAVIS